MNSSIIRIGAFLGMLAVMLGAFGAHAIKNMVDAHSMEIWNKGVLYQFIHAIALMLTGIICLELPVKQLKLAAAFFAIGIILFSGSLYILTFSKSTSLHLGWVGPITPIGGLSFLTGWILILFASSKKQIQKIENH